MPVTWLKIDEEPQPVRAPEGLGLTYSTAPRRGFATNGVEYFFKGPAPEVAITEALAYQLASLVGLNVPEWGLVRHPIRPEVYFVSRSLRSRFFADTYLKNPRLTENPELMGQCIAFDVWICNPDRNMGNIVAEPVGGREHGSVQLYAIDFEKSLVLQGVSKIMITASHPTRAFWPREDLGRLCAGTIPESRFCECIRGVSGEALTSIFDEMQGIVPDYPMSWASNAVSFLRDRSERIHELVAEAAHA